MRPTSEQISELSIKKSRRALLMTLKMFYPDTNPSFAELRMVMPDVEDHYLKVDLEYLCDKGYALRVCARPGQSWVDREFRLSALGVETADRINRDPALEA